MRLASERIIERFIHPIPMQDGELRICCEPFRQGGLSCARQTIDNDDEWFFHKDLLPFLKNVRSVPPVHWQIKRRFFDDC